MLKLDNNLLEELGLGSLPEAQKRQMLQHIYDTLELRVGTQLANQMTDKQLEEFEKFIDSGGDANQAQALQWLEANLPNYKEVVQQTFDTLKMEVKSMAPQLLASAAQQPQEAQIVSQPPVAPAPQQSYAPPAPQPYAAPQAIPPSPQQVMPSQQVPAGAGVQSWQQPMQAPQPVAPQAPSPYAQQPPVVPADPLTNAPQPTPTADPFAQQPQPSPVQPSPTFGQSQPQAAAPTPPPAAPAWQPQPPVQPWQPEPPTNQQPPQAA